MKDSTATKKILSVLLLMLTAFFLFSCSSYTPEDAINEYFDALNRLDFETAGALLDDETRYENITNTIKNPDSDASYDNLQSLYFIDFIYSNISREIIDSVHSDSYSVYHCKISAYNAEEVLKKVHDDAAKLMNTQLYINAGEQEKYDLLCEQLTVSYAEMTDVLTKKETEIDIKVTEKNNTYCLMTSEDLFNAIGGYTN